MASISSPSMIDVVSHRLGIEPALTTYLIGNSPILAKANPEDPVAVNLWISGCQSSFYNHYAYPYGPKDPERPPLNTYQKLVLRIWGNNCSDSPDEESYCLTLLKEAVTKDPRIIDTRTPLIFERCLDVSRGHTESGDRLTNTTLLMLAFLRRKYLLAGFMLEQPNCDVHAVSTCGLRAIECLAMERVLGNNPGLACRHLRPWESNSSPQARDCLNKLLEKDVNLLPLEDNPKPTIFHLFALHDNVEGLALVLNKQKRKIGIYNEQILRAVQESTRNHFPEVLSNLTSQYLFQDLSTILEMRCVGNFREFGVIQPLDYRARNNLQKSFTCIESYTPLLAALNSGATRTAALLLQEDADSFARTKYSEGAKAISTNVQDWSVDDFLEGRKITHVSIGVLRATTIGAITYRLRNDEEIRQQLCDLLKKHRAKILRPPV